MPWLDKIYQRYKDTGLNVIGLTTVNNSSTDQKVRKFISVHEISFPILKENGSARQYLHMTGTPMITIVRDGFVVWEHRLPTEQFPEELVLELVKKQ